MSPLVALLWAVVTVVLAGTAQAADSHGTGQQASSTASSGTGAASSQTPSTQTTERSAPSLPPAAVGHARGSSGHGPTALQSSTQQPISTADANSGGANGQCPGGPYCSTTDGTASGNGNGGGNATGKPCAGCVGKADNKNPHGQMPNASDANAGYECDTNHGIARGNPAHSGCRSASPEQCIPTTDNPCVPPCVVTPQNPCGSPPPECVPTTENPCTPPSPPTCEPAPCVSPPITGSGGPNPPATVSPPQRTLPNTGAPADLAWLAVTAFASILAGAALLFARGRRMPLARS